ncbi:hypothetical protein [uncultured Ruminobacter sp.]|uniref:hypothetical protein n=1 Tax=uncultured Ruminobacter sp. TaxID=538947 RepID=UPI0025ED62D6|nr:hypothetical protein [uncultured Ruminobacter sp.]
MAHTQLYDYEPKEPVLLGGTHSQFSTDGGTTWKALRGAQEIGDIGDIAESVECTTIDDDRKRYRGGLKDSSEKELTIYFYDDDADQKDLIAAAMGANFDASAKQAEATNAAIHGLDESVKTVTDSIEAQTKTVTDLGTKQSKVTKEISKTLETQNSQQKDANTTLAEQRKIMQEQEAEIKKVTKAVDTQTGVLQKNAGGWKMLMTSFAIKFASEVVDGFKSIISTGLEASRVYEDMSARLTPLVGDLETAQKTFWSLNGLKDETATATDKLAKAFVDLGNNGLTNSNEQLKTYATIAHGTGRDINTLTDAVIAFSQGSTKALRQFGGENVTYEGIGATKKWERIESYGPKFVENIVQAIARDILCYAMKTLRHCSIVMHIHDELVIEANPRMSLDAVCEQMGRTPPWAEGLILDAAGYIMSFYKKD